MRRLSLAASVALICATLAQPVVAQFRVGGQAAFLTNLEEVEEEPQGDLEGTFGVGPRVEFQAPIPTVQVGIVGQGVYYFPDGDFNYLTYGLGAKVGFTTPVVSPYAIGGWQWRRTSADDFDSVTEDGPTLGVGLGLGTLPVFIEATFEFNDDDDIDTEDIDNDPMVIQAGVLIPFGGSGT